MPLRPNSRLDHYVVVESIGAGGMGEVYRARDETLGRDVAIKVLPDALAADTERLARFEREAKLLATLNHPGIATVHGFERSGDTRFLVYRKLAEGIGSVERLTESSLMQQTQAFTPDGQWIIARDIRADTGTDLTMTSLTTDREERTLLASETDELNAEISPDGRWLAYESEETGQAEVYVRPFPDVDTGKWQISRGGGAKPLWRRDGSELFYLAPRGRMMAVPVELGDSFVFCKSTELFQGEYLEESRGRTYDVTSDGKRFIMVKYGREASGAEHGEIVTVLNWTEELKGLLPRE